MSYRRKNKLSVVNIGLKMFAKNKGNQISEVGYRILMEGLDILLPVMDNRRIIEISKELFLHYTTVHDHSVNFDDLKANWNATSFETKSIGSAVVTFEGFAVPVWIGKNNVSLMVSKEEI